MDIHAPNNISPSKHKRNIRLRSISASDSYEYQNTSFEFKLSILSLWFFPDSFALKNSSNCSSINYTIYFHDCFITALSVHDKKKKILNYSFQTHVTSIIFLCNNILFALNNFYMSNTSFPKYQHPFFQFKLFILSHSFLSTRNFILDIYT